MDNTPEFCIENKPGDANKKIHEFIIYYKSSKCSLWQWGFLFAFQELKEMSIS